MNISNNTGDFSFFKTEDLLKGWNGLIENFEHCNQVLGQEEPDDVLPNLKKAQKIISDLNEQKKHSSKSNWSRIVENKLVPIKFKVLKNKPKNGAFQKVWDENYDKLIDFMDQNEHTNVTRSTPELGNWVAEQRRKFRRGKITESQFIRLNNIGFEWDRSYYFHNTYQNNKRSPK